MAEGQQRQQYQSQPTLLSSLPSLLAPILGERFAQHDHNNDPVPISKTHGVVGRDRILVAKELKRLQGAKTSSKRRTAASFAGISTIVVGGVTAWFLAEAVIALIRSSIHLEFSQWLFSLIETILNGLSILLICTIVPWIRKSRGRTVMSTVVVQFSVLVFLLQLAVVVLNGILIYVWRNELKQRCTAWAVDVVWRMQSEVCATPLSSLEGYWTAFGVRLAVTLIVGACWLLSLHHFNRILHDQRRNSSTEGDFLDTAEVRSILDAYDARVISLPADFDHTQVAHEEHDLPPMPERRHLLSEEEQGQTPAEYDNPPAQPSWFSSIVSWAFGINPAATNSETRDLEAQEMEQHDSGFRVLSSSVVAQESRFAGNPLHPDYLQFQRPIPPEPIENSRRPTHQRKDSQEEVLLDAAERQPLSRSSNPPMERIVDRETEDWQEYDSTTSESDEFDQLRNSHGSENMVQRDPKPTVYVRMGSGHLVHRLSTVYSASSNRGSIDSTNLLNSSGGPLYMSGAWRGSAGSEVFR